MNIIDMLEDPVSKIIIILLIIITASIIVRLVAYLMNKIKRFKKRHYFDLSYQRHYKLYNLFHSINVHIANI